MGGLVIYLPCILTVEGEKRVVGAVVHDSGLGAGGKGGRLVRFTGAEGNGRGRFEGVMYLPSSHTHGGGRLSGSCGWV